MIGWWRCDRVELSCLARQPNTDSKHVDIPSVNPDRLGYGPFRVQIRDTIRDEEDNIGHAYPVPIGHIKHLLPDNHQSFGRVSATRYIGDLTDGIDGVCLRTQVVEVKVNMDLCAV